MKALIVASTSSALFVPRPRQNELPGVPILPGSEVESGECLHGPLCFTICSAIARTCEVRLIAPRPWWEFRGPEWRRLGAGVPALFPVYWPISRQNGSAERALYRSLRAPAERMRADFRFDAILATADYPDAAAAARLARAYGCALVLLALRPASAPELGRAFGQSHRIIAGGETVRDWALSQGATQSKLVVCPSGSSADAGDVTVEWCEDAARACSIALASAAGISARVASTR